MSEMYQYGFKLPSIRNRDVWCSLHNGCLNHHTRCKAPMSISKHVYGHQNTARRTETRLKKRHCTTPVLSFVVRYTRIAVSLYAALSRESEEK
ncbi:hypothetical protein TNCV_2103131 [Trichonephila clavipes]|nr:hypothetical protein TNCV_2103131 [Trichonephila clavipes]